MEIIALFFQLPFGLDCFFYDLREIRIRVQIFICDNPNNMKEKKTDWRFDLCFVPWYAMTANIAHISSHEQICIQRSVPNGN